MRHHSETSRRSPRPGRWARWPGRILLLLATAAGPTVAAGQVWEQLLENGDLSRWQDGAPVGWSVVVGATEDPQRPVSELLRIADGPDGRPALRLRGEARTGVWQVVMQEGIPVAPGDVLCLGGWLRTRDVARDGHRFANCQLGLQCLDAKGDLLFYQMPLAGTGTRPWTAGRLAVTMPPQAATVRVLAFLSMSGAADFAGLSLERLRLPEPDPELGAVGRWRTDLDLLDAGLRRVHPDPFRHLAADAYAGQLAALARDAGADPVRSSLELMRLIARLGDAHTRVLCPELTSAPVPLGLWDFADGWHVTATVSAHADLLAARVTAVGETPVGEAVVRLGECVPHENPEWLRAMVPRLLTQPRLLHALQLAPTDTAVQLTVVTPDGVRRTASVGPGDGSTAAAVVSALPDADQRAPGLQDHGPYWYARLAADRQVAYLQYRACREDPARPLADFTGEVLDAVPTHCFVLDLRANGGGDSRLLEPLLQGVARLAERGVVGQTWLLTGRQTFSSAALNAATFVQLTGARVAGEPMGNPPDHFGQPIAMELPNTRIRFQCSAKSFHPGGLTAADLAPDLALEVRAADWFAGRDPVLEAILARCP